MDSHTANATSVATARGLQRGTSRAAVDESAPPKSFARIAGGHRKPKGALPNQSMARCTRRPRCPDANTEAPGSSSVREPQLSEPLPRNHSGIPLLRKQPSQQITVMCLRT